MNQPATSATAATDVLVRLAVAEDMHAVFALRYDVFVIGQAVPADLERDDLDAAADHIVAARGGVVVGTGRLLAPGVLEPDATIGRMAVAERARGAGVGAAVLARLEQQAGLRGWPAVELHAQLHAEVFYRRAGYRPFGETYLEAGIAHIGMRKHL